MVEGGVYADGLSKANRQLLLAAELTFDDDQAERLAALAHEVGELAAGGRFDADEMREIDRRLWRLREETHTDVRAAIVRAQELLSPYHESPAPA